MQKVEWKKLQNGSDIRGVALADGGNPVNLTTDVVKTIGSAFALWLADKKSKEVKELSISIGHDSRLTAKSLSAAAIDGITDFGADVVNCNLCSTPAMFMTTVTEGHEYDGAVMLTASHLPFDRNGMKFFTREGGLEKQDISKILELSEKIYNGEIKPDANKKGSVKDIDFVSVYAEDLVAKIRDATEEEKPLEGFKIIVDAGNGAGGFFADKVLEVLGADTNGSQFLDPDGTFPNHIPNPEDKEAMESICDAVIKKNADLGIIFDTDVDRAAVVDRFGRDINRNRIIALISAIVLGERKGATIVTDSITSEGLKKFIEEDLGGVHHRFKRGYKNVINEAIRLNEEGTYTPVAIETSGHCALMENYFLDDGAYLIAKILIQMAKLKKENRTIDQLIENLEEPKEEKEFRMKINLDDFKEYGQKVIDGLADYTKEQEGWIVEPVNHEGIRVKCHKGNGDGWFLLRLSLHDPILPLNIESDSDGGVKVIAKSLLEYLEHYDKLDLSGIKSFIEE